uniref:Uncharacterized protein n=1 Tax=Anguilla anguilla TaxID=7936 RepID=A0A0E9T2J2_ANGAN
MFPSKTRYIHSTTSLLFLSSSLTVSNPTQHLPSFHSLSARIPGSPFS